LAYCTSCGGKYFGLGNESLVVMKRNGLLQPDYGAVIVLDLAALQQLAE
jgi:hypothetical protein